MENLSKKIREDQKGFTLVEMMVVVIIIGILVAVAVPVYSSTQRKAKETACEANIRMIKSAIRQAQLEEEDVTAGTLDDDKDTGVEKYFESIPECPLGGSYKIEGNSDDGYTVICTHNTTQEGSEEK